MPESENRYFPTARERLDRGEEPQSPRFRDANFLLTSDAPGRNLDASTNGRQRKNGTSIRVRRRGR